MTSGTNTKGVKSRQGLPGLAPWQDRRRVIDALMVSTVETELAAGLQNRRKALCAASDFCPSPFQAGPRAGQRPASARARLTVASSEKNRDPGYVAAGDARGYSPIPTRPRSDSGEGDIGIV